MGRGAGIALTIGALALLGGAALLMRVRRDREPEKSAEAPSAVVASAKAPEAAAARPPHPDSPAGVSLQIARLLLQIDQEAKAAAKRPPNQPLPADVRILGESAGQDAEDLGRRLADLLREDPAAWDSVLDALITFNNPAISNKVLSLIAESVDGGLESHIADQARTDDRREARRLAVAALGTQKSPESLTALMAVADGDKTALVRRDAVLALWERRRVSQSENEKRLIDDALRRRSQVETDPGVKRLARKMLGLEPPVARPQPAPRQRRTSQRLKAAIEAKRKELEAQKGKSPER